MFNSNPLGPHNFNEGMIDRLLGKAYLTIKEVHDNLPDIVKAIAVSEDSKELTASIDKLSEVLKGFDTSAGMFLGHDLGTVGEPVDSNTFVGENYLSEFTKSAEQVKIVGDNIDVVNRLVVHINELKAIAEALTSLLTVNDNLPEIIKTNEQLTDIKVVASNISDVRSVKECLSEIITLAESINYFPEIIHSADDIAKVAKYISSLVICAGNIATYVEANERLKTAQEVIANDNLATVANNVEAVKSVAAKMADIETLNQLDPRITTLETTTADHETRITANKKVIDNHELRLNNIETTTDLGQVTLRITAIEAKNKEQDTSLEANATAIAKETSDREQAITTEAKAREDADNALGVRIDNADAKNTEQDTKLGTIDTHLETIDTHLGTIDEKNTAQDTALDTAKNELNASISALSQKVQANYIDKTSEQEITTGVKTFSGGSDVNVFVVKGDFDLTQAPTKTCYSTIPFHDKNDKVYAYLQAEYNTEQTRAVRILVPSDTDRDTFCVVGALLDKAGKPHTFTNHPDTSCTTNEIATAYFVKKVVPFPAWSTKISVPINGTVFTVPTDGWIDVTLEAYNNVQGVFSINGELRLIAQSRNVNYSTRGNLLIPVVKGDQFFVKSCTGTLDSYAFFYSLKYGSVS